MELLLINEKMIIVYPFYYAILNLEATFIASNIDLINWPD